MYYFKFIIFCVFNILLFASASTRLSMDCAIYITISLQNSKDLEQAGIELNWGPRCNAKPEWIGLFSANPAISNTRPQFVVKNITSSEGKVLTKFKLGKVIFPTGYNRNERNHVKPQVYLKGKCLPFYIASFNGNELLTAECLKIQPNWMSSLDHLNKMPLKNLFIPGTHAAGAFKPKNMSGSKLLNDYVIAQQYDIWTQLMFGIRFLDLSIGFRSDTRSLKKSDNFWIANENIFINPLRDILLDIKQFLNLTNEIVIIDFSSFPIGFYGHAERHSSLASFLMEIVGDIAYVPQKQANGEKTACYMLSLDDVRKQNKSLLILYPIEELQHPEIESDILCTNWKRFSTALMNSSQSLDYMSMLFSKKNSQVGDEGWIFQAIRSFEQSLNTDKLQTTKERAMIINTKVCNWLGGPWSLTANVVTLDFWSSTNLVDICLGANMHKAYDYINRNLTNFEIAK